MFSGQGGGGFWATLDACVQSSNNTSVLKSVIDQDRPKIESDAVVYHEASSPSLKDPRHFSRAVTRPGPGHLLERNQHAIKQLVIDSAINKFHTDKSGGLLRYVALRNFSNDVENSVGAIADVAVTAHFGVLLSPSPRPVAKHKKSSPVSFTPTTSFKRTKTPLQTSVSVPFPVTCLPDQLMDFSTQQWFATVPPYVCFEQTSAATTIEIETTAANILTTSMRYYNTIPNTNAPSQIRVQHQNHKDSASTTPPKLTRSQLRRQQRWYAKQLAKAQQASSHVDQLHPKTMKASTNLDVGTVPDIDTNANAYTDTKHVLRQAASVFQAKLPSSINYPVDNALIPRVQQQPNQMREYMFLQQQQTERPGIGLNYGVAGQNVVDMAQMLLTQNTNFDNTTMTHSNEIINMKNYRRAMQPNNNSNHRHHLKNRSSRDRKKTTARTNHNQHPNYNHDSYHHNNSNEYSQSMEYLQSSASLCFAN
eukprot:m.85622 g.85622  ORF g.85622 m.85622 type:complete len:478 (-) comp25885_c2_seq1:443-1876(-)